MNFKIKLILWCHLFKRRKKEKEVSHTVLKQRVGWVNTLFSLNEQIKENKLHVEGYCQS